MVLAEGLSCRDGLSSGIGFDQLFHRALSNHRFMVILNHTVNQNPHCFFACMPVVVVLFALGKEERRHGVGGGGRGGRGVRYGGRRKGGGKVKLGVDRGESCMRAGSV